MVIEAILLLYGELQSYRQLKHSRDFAYIASNVGYLASAVLPREAMMTTHYHLQRSEVARRDMNAAREATDRTAADVAHVLAANVGRRGDIGEIYRELRDRRDGIERFRRIADETNISPAALRAELKPYSGALIRLVALLRFEMQDPESSRMMHFFLDLLQVNGASLDITFYGGNYLGGQGATPDDLRQMAAANTLLTDGMRRLRTYPESQAIRHLLDFQDSVDGQWLSSMTDEVQRQEASPSRELVRKWRFMKEKQLAALRQDIAQSGQSIRAIGDELAARARLQFYMLLAASLILLGLVLTVLVLAVKSIRFSARLLRERESMIGELHAAAYTDAMTGLLNRRGFDEAVRSIAGAKPQAVAAVIIFDLDRFKHVNDTHGHDVGDIVLRQTAAIARAHFRTGDLLARYGGEEFIAFLPETSVEDAVRLADRVRQAIHDSENRIDERQVLHVTASFGCAAVKNAGDRAQLNHSLKKADLSLYAAKAAGRNRVVAETELEAVTAVMQAATA